MKQICLLFLLIFSASCVAHTDSDNIHYEAEVPYILGTDIDDLIAPEVYALVAARTTNQMLDEAAPTYEKTPRPKLYLMKTKQTTENLPHGFYQARREMRDIIQGAKAFDVVTELNEADYYIETTVDSILSEQNTSSETNLPAAIAYHLKLYTSQNELVGEWTQVIKRVQNDDRSWW